MKIASITNTPLQAHLGSGKTVIEWSSGLKNLGHEVDVFAPEDFYHPFPSGRFNRLKMRCDALTLEKRLLKGEYDLLEFFGGEFGWLMARIAAKSPRPLLVAHTNGLELLAYGSEEMTLVSQWKRILASPVDKLVKQCDYLAFAKADRFAAICALDAQYIVSRGIQTEDRVVVVEPGIDKEYLTAKWDQPKQNRVVYLGSWARRKDTPTLIAVLSLLMTKDATLEFDIVGSGSSKHEVQRTFPTELRARIHVYPRLEKLQIAAILSKSKVFIFPSLYEGFGMATAEAMACGCAAVITPTGFGGSLRDGVEALVRPFRDADGIAKAAEMLLNNEEMRVRIAEAGRSRVIAMTWERQVRLLDMTYRQWRQQGEKRLCS